MYVCFWVSHFELDSYNLQLRVLTNPVQTPVYVRVWVPCLWRKEKQKKEKKNMGIQFLLQLPTSESCRGASFLTAAAAKSLQSCPTLCNPIDGSPPGSPIPGILQARILEGVAISFSKAWKWKVKVKLLSRVRLFETPWTAAHQAPPIMGFSRQEYWSGLPLPSLINIMISLYSRT